MDPIKSLNLKLGQKAPDDATLDAVPRSISRQDLDLSTIAMHGVDIWNAHEVTFLMPGGRPATFIMRCAIPAHSPNLVESKSLKLFLFDQSHREFVDPQAFSNTVGRALEACVEARVALTLLPPPPVSSWATNSRRMEGIWLDRLPLGEDRQPHDARLILPDPTVGAGEYRFFSHLIMTRCPVTDQPDFASIQIDFSGEQGVSAESLLHYLLAFRGVPMFHETFCERVFCDLMHRVAPTQLEVTCYFCRRGGIDITPHRTTDPDGHFNFAPTWRQ